MHPPPPHPHQTGLNILPNDGMYATAATVSSVCKTIQEIEYLVLLCRQRTRERIVTIFTWSLLLRVNGTEGKNEFHGPETLYWQYESFQ
jgi:hypothetical protein